MFCRNVVHSDRVYMITLPIVNYVSDICESVPVYIHFYPFLFKSIHSQFDLQIFILKLFSLSIPLIDWCLMPILAVFQLYHGVNKFYIDSRQKTD
jgi:hypothetical protein